MTCNVRIATADDADAACAVLRRSISECCFEDHHGDSEVLRSWLLNKTPENIRAWIQYPAGFAVVAEVDARISGFGLLSSTGTVALCYLVPEARFIGAGKAMLAAMEAEAIRRGLTSLNLESTLTALPFYGRNGFVRTGEPNVGLGVKGFPMEKPL